MMIFMSAFIAFLSMCFTVWKLGDQWVRRMFGYDYIIDITMGLFLTVIFGMTATITGVLVAVVTNFMIGIGLWIGKNTYGYEQIRFSHWKFFIFPVFYWQRYEGQWIIDLRTGSNNILKKMFVRRAESKQADKYVVRQRPIKYPKKPALIGSY